MKTTTRAKDFVHTHKQWKPLEKIVSSGILAALFIFLIYQIAYRTGANIETTFLKEWFGATTAIFLWRRYNY